MALRKCGCAGQGGKGLPPGGGHASVIYKPWHCLPSGGEGERGGGGGGGGGGFAWRGVPCKRHLQPLALPAFGGRFGFVRRGLQSFPPNAPLQSRRDNSNRIPNGRQTAD